MKKRSEDNFLLGKPGPSGLASPSCRASFLEVVYEDDDLLILDKKSGIPSVPHSPEETETAVGSALAHFPSLSEVGKKGLEPGILHRLDTLTSGLLVFAKTDAEFKCLKALWKSGEVRKYYRAIVIRGGEFPPCPWTISTPLAHSAKSSRRMVALVPGRRPPKIRGKPLAACTVILTATPVYPGVGVVDRLRELEKDRLSMRADPGQKASPFDLEIEIKTGVMHQIRCHLASVGWPIVGDPIYGRRFGRGRLWLHAWRLELPRRDGKFLRVEANLPEGWGREGLISSALNGEI